MEEPLLIRAFGALTVASALLLSACASAPGPRDAPTPAPSGPILETPAAPAPASGRAPAAQPIDAAKLPPFEGEKRELGGSVRIVTIDRTVPPEDLWERIRRGFAIPDLDSPLVRDKMAFYAARPEYLQRVFDRSRLYLYHIVEELEKRGMPTELALLPIVESAFNPMAYSRAHASGLWQFIPGTGKRYDLQQNWWYDARRDIVESTAAALEYLSKLYDMHGDWQLALASYNWGEGAVARAIEKNRRAGKPTDYAHLTMPVETRQYIPKLQALKNIIRDPKPFAIDLSPIPNEPYFVTYEQVQDMDVQLAAKLAEMPVEEFIALNPAFSRPIIRAADTPRIILPADKIDVFHANLEKHQKSLVSWKTYQPKKGESLETIAKRHGMTLAQLKQVNGIPSRSRGLPTLLVVPVDRTAGASFERLPIMYAPPIPVVYRRIFHTVKPGETLASIARRYSVTVEDLKRLNHVGRLSVGQRLAVEVRSTGKSRSKAKPRPKAKPKQYKKADS
ncbi:MAG: transglycosylase SLT domain-containing protein [Betaproteobacteria bacterium]|nr:transglycosylase SLT domain-containing protein [Betaproteobacteria bacterium]